MKNLIEEYASIILEALIGLVAVAAIFGMLAEALAL